MSIGSKMRSLGDSTYFLKTTYEPLKEIIGDKDCIFEKDPINGYIIHTDRIEGELLENVDELLNDEFGNKFRKTHYNHHIEVNWRDIDKYAKCTNYNDMVAVNNTYAYDVTSDGEWVYPLPELLTANRGNANGLFSWQSNKGVKKIAISLPKARNISPNTSIIPISWVT